jgi:hypothetical protein
MSRTQKFRDQHADLLQLATELQALLQPAKLAADATAARACLSRLMGKLTMHLAAEDKVLYPELCHHADSAVATLARKFSTEMQNTTPVVVNYNGKWSTPSSIKSEPAKFIAETQQILKVLGDRIRRENQELYAAADRLDGHAFG